METSPIVAAYMYPRLCRCARCQCCHWLTAVLPARCGAVHTFLIADESAFCQLCLWNEMGSYVRPGDIFELKQGCGCGLSVDALVSFVLAVPLCARCLLGQGSQGCESEGQGLQGGLARPLSFVFAVKFPDESNSQ